MEVNQTVAKVQISLRVKLVLAICAVLLFSISLNTTLNYLNFEKRLTSTTDSIYHIVVEETHNDINQAISLGLPLSAISNLQSLLERRIELVSGIDYISINKPDGEVLFSTGNPNIDETARLLHEPIHNTFGVKEGELNLYYSTDELNQSMASLLKRQIGFGLFWVAVSALIGFLTLRYLLNSILSRVNSAEEILSAGQNEPILDTLNDAHRVVTCSEKLSKWGKFKQKRFPVLIIGLAILLTIIANIGSSYQSLSAFSKIYEETLQQKSLLIGDSLATMINRLVESGVPLDQLHGLEKEFSFYTRGHEELLSISLLKDTQPLYLYPQQVVTNKLGNTSLVPIQNAGEISLQVQTDGNIIVQMLKESLMDMLTVLVASCLVVAEIIMFLCHFMILSPWSQIKQLFLTVNRDVVSYLAKISASDELGRLQSLINQSIIKLNPSKPTKEFDRADYRFIRLPLFLLVFAEAASLAFFPNYVASLDNSSGWIPENLVTSLPISLFMLCWALSLPFAGYWSDKVGRRYSLTVGGLVTSLGLMATALISNLELLLLTRAITAIGYGIVFISAQGYVTDTTNDSNRTKGMATFLSAFFSGSLCGAAIGGILADKLGYSATFILAGLLACSSVMLVLFFFEKGKTNGNSKPVQLSDFRLLLSNKYFALITVFSAIPAKIVLTGFLYYICPVYLQFLGESSSVSGRVMMGYGLAIIVISPLSAILVDKYRNKMAFIVLGGMLSAMAMLNFMLLDGTAGILMIVILIGIAHGICVSPQIPLVIELLSNQGIDKGKIIGIFRLTERLGNIVGPMLAGITLGVLGFDATILIFGASLAFSSLSLIIFYTIFLKSDKSKAEVAQ